MSRVGVIVPFYQRKPGILATAVKSVLAQSEKNLVVIVVDDGSPVSAREELAPLMARDGRIAVVEQPNQGPGAARNRGLDAMPDDVTTIAFLDSDDQWRPDHLANGLMALRRGADFYFADVDDMERGQGASHFAACHFDGSPSEPIPDYDHLFFYKGGRFDIVISTSPIFTPSVIFRRSVAPALRFRQGLIAGEDRLFWLGLLSKAKRVAFSTHCEVVSGRGVNIYAGVRWGTPIALRSLLDTARSYRMMTREFPLSPGQRRSIAGRLRAARREFASNLVHFLHHREEINWSHVRAYFASDPLLALSVIRVLITGTMARK